MTSLAYNTAYEIYRGIPSAEELNREIYDSLSRGLLINPNLYIYLRLHPDEMRRRLKNRRDRPPSILPDFWQKNEFILPFIQFYEDFFANLNVKIIDATKTPEEILYECLGFLG